MAVRAASPSRRQTALALALLGGAGLAVTERRHLRTIAADPDYLALSAALPGRDPGPVVCADGTRLNVRAYGSDDPGDPVLVLAHGWTERIGFWGPVIRRLAGPQLRIVAYDLRGHGDSAAAADDDYGLERFGEDLEAVLAAHGGLPARTAVAGHSLGAMSIAAWAAGFPVSARIAAAALINTGLDDLIGGALILGAIGARITPAWMSRALLGSGRPLLPVSTPLSQTVARHVAFGPDASDGSVAFYERMLMETEPSARAATGIALSTLDLSAAVARLDVPTLVVAGDRDRLTPPAHARRIHAALPEPAGLLELERTGHMSPLERPAEVADALGGLLRAAQVLVPATAETTR